MTIDHISFRCAEKVRPELAAAAERIPYDQRPFPYTVGESTDLISAEKYVAIDPDEEAEVSEEQAATLVHLIHAEAGKPKLEAVLWGTGDKMKVITL